MKRLLIALAAVLLTPLSVEAKVDPNTRNLINTVESHGFDVLYDPVKDCGMGNVGGLIDFDHKYIALCLTDRTIADNHDTVRHEAVHLAQYCATKRRGYDYLAPLIDSRTKLSDFVEAVLPDQEIVAIKSMYTRDRWLPELEAAAVARYYSADWVSRLVNKWC